MGLITTMKQGDTAPSLKITCLNGVTPVDLSSAGNIRLHVSRRNGSTVVDQTVTGNNVGLIVYNWQTADTASLGLLMGEVEVTWGDGKKQSFPAEGYFTIRIVEDLDVG